MSISVASLTVWLTTAWTLVAAGAWKKKELHAWDWTRWAFAGTFWSSILILVAVSFYSPFTFLLFPLNPIEIARS